MKRLIIASRGSRDLWDDIIYIYDKIVNRGQEEWADEYTAAWMQLGNISNRGYAKANTKYRDLYNKLSNSYLDYDESGNRHRVYNEE